MAALLEALPGTYVLWMKLEEDRRIRVGKLGTFRFEAGVYGYVGSARGPGGIRARVGRHCRSGKPSRWHIDYFRRAARVLESWVSYDPDAYEHPWVQALRTLPGARVPVAGFGASDCACVAHLLCFEMQPSLAAFRRTAAPTYSLERIDAADL